MNRSISLLIALLLLSPAGVAADEAAWQMLESARRSLAEASPLEARFVQTYVPAGFTDGDRENGRLYLSLPTCLRWDYEAPYPRSYMLCGRTVWSWAPDEPVGDRLLEVSREEAGVDFLLLSTDRLRQRYEARTDPEGDHPSVHLEPTSDDAPFVRATIELDPRTNRPRDISYVDRQGNTTRFSLSDYARPQHEAIFEPPEIRWIDG